jgi:hypothetical protein
VSRQVSNLEGRVRSPVTAPIVRVSPCTNAAAKYAVERWHYSRSLPVGRLVRYGVWEDDEFVGVVLFGRGASPYLLTPYGLTQYEGAELTRVALSSHSSFVSQIVSLALGRLKESNPGLRLVVSFADSNQGHHGGIYQAGNWIYTGMSAPKYHYIGPDGKRYHDRLIHSGGVFRADQCKAVHEKGKHRYLMPLDKAIRRQVLKLSSPYPSIAGEV